MAYHFPERNPMCHPDDKGRPERGPKDCSGWACSRWRAEYWSTTLRPGRSQCCRVDNRCCQADREDCSRLCHRPARQQESASKRQWLRRAEPGCSDRLRPAHSENRRQEHRGQRPLGCKERRYPNVRSALLDWKEEPRWQEQRKDSALRHPGCNFRKDRLAARTQQREARSCSCSVARPSTARRHSDHKRRLPEWSDMRRVVWSGNRPRQDWHTRSARLQDKPKARRQWRRRAELRQEQHRKAGQHFRKVPRWRKAKPGHMPWPEHRRMDCPRCSPWWASLPQRARSWDSWSVAESAPRQRKKTECSSSTAANSRARSNRRYDILPDSGSPG
jgi:hypothetical protein